MKTILHLAISLILLSLFACSSTNYKANAQAVVGEELPTIPNSNDISVSAKDSSKFIRNIIGNDYLKFPYHTDFYWVNDSAENIEQYFNQHLPENGWQVNTQWGYPFQNAMIDSSWMKGENELTILLLNDLDKVEIKSLSDNYTITGLQSGSTLVVLHVINKAQQP